MAGDILLYVTLAFVIIYLITLAVSYQMGSLLFVEYDHPVDLDPSIAKKFNRPYGSHIIPIKNTCVINDTRNFAVRAFHAMTGYAPPADSDLQIISTVDGKPVDPPDSKIPGPAFGTGDRAFGNYCNPVCVNKDSDGNCLDKNKLPLPKN